MKKTNMITTIQNKELELWNEVKMYLQIMNDQRTECTELLYKMARAKWLTVYGLMNDLGIEILHE